MICFNLLKLSHFHKTFRFVPLLKHLNIQLLENVKYYNKFETQLKYKWVSFYSNILNKTNNNFNYENILKTKNILKIKSNSKTKSHLWSWDVISGILVWLGLLDDYEQRENPFILTIKRGILCMQRKEYEKAELILHSALKMAQDLNYGSAETYILDLLANNAFQKEDLKIAEKLFIEVLKRVISEGMKPNEEPIIEISIKLSTIYSKNGEFNKCDEGFGFCLNEQQKRVEPFVNKSLDEMSKEEINSMALLGMCLDYYAKHLSSIAKFEKAINYYESALSICRKINGNLHPQTLVLLNDTATTFMHLNDYENALAYLKKAIDGAIRTDSEDLAAFYYNIGSLYLSQSNKELAELSCRESLDFSLKLKDKILEKKARECLLKAVK